jgi:hypothetical protein
MVLKSMFMLLGTSRRIGKTNDFLIKTGPRAKREEQQMRQNLAK